MGISNWTNSQDSDYGKYFIQDDNYIEPTPILYDRRVKCLKFQFFTHNLFEYYLDIKSTCKLTFSRQTR